jgi:hypothetical protein
MHYLRRALRIFVFLASVCPTPSVAQNPGQPVSTLSALPAIEANPNPVPANHQDGSTRITWTTGDGSEGLVYASRNGEAEALFARGPVGSSVASWIAGGAAYKFRLYSATTPRVLLASVKVQASGTPSASGDLASEPAATSPVRARPVLTASPNPVPGGNGLGTTEIAWDVGEGSVGRVLVSADGAEATQFASGPRGTSPAPWIRAGSTYEFRLYGDATPEVPLASVVVTRRDADARALVLIAESVGGLLVLLLLVRGFVRLASATRRLLRHHRSGVIDAVPAALPLTSLLLSTVFTAVICGDLASTER